MSRTVRTFAAVCAVLLSLSLTVIFVSAATVSYSSDSYAKVPVYLEGIRVGSGLVINEVVYVPFRDAVSSLEQDAVVEWDEYTRTITATFNGLTISAQADNRYITANEKYLFIPSKIIVEVDGEIFVSVYAIAYAFNHRTTLNEEFGTIDISMHDGAAAPSEAGYYTEEDLYWLAQIISAEAKNQPLNGKIGVGNVVLNRLNSAAFSYNETIKDVIFDKKNGVQFYGAYTSTMKTPASDQCVQAAILCLNGKNTVGNSKYFVNPDYADDSWFKANLRFKITIGDHDFYV